MKRTHSKLKPIAASLLLAMGAAGTASAEISDKFTVGGFVDMSWTYADIDGGSSEQSAGIDQVEFNIGYQFDDKLSATVDIEYQDNGTGEEVDLEQAFVSYAVSDQFSIKAGRFLSYTGWETEEPTGLFQYSGTGYAAYFYGGYQQGVSGIYSGDGFAVALSVVNDLGDLEGEARDSEQPGFETMLAIMPTEEITIKGFYSTDSLDGTSEDTTLVNLWASYSTGALTLAAEYNTSENAPAYVFGGAGIDAEASGYLLMGNYAFDSFGLTLRYHDWEIETATGATYEDASGFTISPSITVSDNLLMVFEYRLDEVNDVDSDFIAVEALITF
ncbi:outer membrane beta-barrel protein [Agaribacter marinus]|uniref:Porin n=1 Tax=Agaribacter marinus TaxID=1431249 RepID=A0AA37WI34_9ALTE|nr:outer membrane beta-barrel protein [Agaribacter marinus]GLR71656.1 hypothetical protein GCM10007852_25640 [Agaribacter marinus]